MEKLPFVQFDEAKLQPIIDTVYSVISDVELDEEYEDYEEEYEEKAAVAIDHVCESLKEYLYKHWGLNELLQFGL